MPTIIEHSHPFDPSKRHVQHSSASSIENWLETHPTKWSTQPFICLVNGEAVLRKDWSNPLASESTVTFMVLPAGGSAGKILTAITAIAISVVAAPIFINAVGGAGAFGASLVSAGLKLAGAVLVGSIFGSEERPRIREFGNTPQASPTYSLQARGNKARLGEPVPVIYGKHRLYPDYAAAPWTCYTKNEQYLHQLFVIGQGEYVIDDIMIDDTPIGNFAEVEQEIVCPGQQPTLFHPDYTAAPEVAGQILKAKVPVGGFAINPPDTTTDKIQIDIVFPSGLYRMNNNGSLASRTVVWHTEARLIDNDGIALKSWTILKKHSETMNTNTAQRFSYEYSVSLGRYEVRLTRLSADSTKDSRVRDRLVWQAAYAKLTRSINTQGITLLAVKMRASNNISQRSRRLINCIVTRKLSSWDSSTGWSPLRPTRSIAWALVDIARAEYGGKLPDGRIDLNAIQKLDSTWSGRKDYCDAVFDQSITVWEALKRVSKCGRAGCFLQGGVLRVVRDQQQKIPVAMFTPRNIVKDSLKIEYRLSDDDSATRIVGEFHNRISWKTDQVTVSLDNDSTRTVKVNFFGITSEAHALREATFLAKANKYRRKLITFRTEMEGFMLSIGDCILITHQMPKWGVGGEVLDYDVQTRIIILSEPVEFTSTGIGYLMLRSANGGIQGTYAVRAISGEKTKIQLTDEQTPKFVTSENTAKTLFAFATRTDALSLPARVIHLTPRGHYTIEITAIYEDNRVHAE